MKVDVRWRARALSFAPAAGAGAAPTLGDLKRFLERETSVPVAAQRLMGVPPNKPDSTPLSQLHLRRGRPLALVGEPVAAAGAALEVAPPAAPPAAPQPGEPAAKRSRAFKLTDALMAAPPPAAPGGDGDEAAAEEKVSPEAIEAARALARERQQRSDKKQEKADDREMRTETVTSASGRSSFTVTYAVEDEARAAAAAAEAPLLQPARPGRKCLVLDLDHTLLDFQQRRGDALQARPLMEAFLSAVSDAYDVVVWSQTSWRWLQLKIQDLIMNPRFRICLVLTKEAMFRVKTVRRGKERAHSVKPLRYVWSKHVDWTPERTLHVDDLERNGALNPRQLVLVSGWYADRDGARDDRELPRLALYLLLVAGAARNAAEENRTWRTLVERTPFRLSGLAGDGGAGGAAD